MRFLTIGFCVGALLVACLIPGEAPAAGEAEIVGLQVFRDPPNLKVSFRIENPFTPQMEEAIVSGIPITFRIFLVLETPGLPMMRTNLLDLTFEHSMKYDTLHNQFQVRRTEFPGETLLTADYEKAKQWMSEVAGIPIIPLWRLTKAQEYRLKVKAELSKVRLPLFFRYMFFFVSLWDFETGWAQIEFSY
ncbi:MAG: DUF4390 domain-containing protein [Thermodesulfobacteriota bacterium]|nr:DUF4390 domain-containing protein [Thermodesulfobacteriota bacterium]